MYRFVHTYTKNRYVERVVVQDRLYDHSRIDHCFGSRVCKPRISSQKRARGGPWPSKINDSSCATLFITVLFLPPLTENFQYQWVIKDHAASDETEAALNYISDLPCPGTQCHSTMSQHGATIQSRNIVDGPFCYCPIRYPFHSTLPNCHLAVFCHPAFWPRPRHST